MNFNEDGDGGGGGGGDDDDDWWLVDGSSGGKDFQLYLWIYSTVLTWLN